MRNHGRFTTDLKISLRADRSMAAPVTHLLVPMILLEVYRRNIAKTRFSFLYVFLGGLLGVAPDLDFILMYAIQKLTGTSVYAHRMITHSIMIVVPLLLIGCLSYMISKNKTYFAHANTRKRLRVTYIICFVAAIAISSHILFDCLDGMDNIAYPFTIDPHLPDVIEPPKLWMMIDGIFLVLWITLDERIFNPLLKWVNGIGKTAAKRRGND